VLAEYEPEEIVALLSAFVFQEKTDVEPVLTASLERGIAKIVAISENVNKLQTLHQVILSSDDSNDFVSKPRFGMVEVVYEWARGMSFNRITDLTDVMEGTIVRVITRLDETCREVKNAARIIGDPTLFQKMGTCQELIKRYVVDPRSYSTFELGQTCVLMVKQRYLQLREFVSVDVLLLSDRARVGMA
jgi:antiviral helicase SKI2